MITFVGTNHHHFEDEAFDLDSQVKLDHFDKVFSEGVSQDEESFEARINEAVEDVPEFDGLEADNIDRGPEPEALDNLDNAKVIYLDEGLPEELLVELSRETKAIGEVREVYPFDNLEEQLIKENETRKDYIQFFRDLRDMGFEEDSGFSSYAALNETYFERLLGLSASHLNRNIGAWDAFDMDNSDEFRAGLEKYDITFQDYVDVFGEKRNDFQDERDKNWYEQIKSRTEEDENVLVVAGIQHALDYEGTLRNLIEKDQRVSAVPYGKFPSESNPF